jgi:hypothetical protein
MEQLPATERRGEDSLHQLGRRTAPLDDEASRSLRAPVLARFAQLELDQAGSNPGAIEGDEREREILLRSRPSRHELELGALEGRLQLVEAALDPQRGHHRDDLDLPASPEQEEVLAHLAVGPVAVGVDEPDRGPADPGDPDLRVDREERPEAWMRQDEQGRIRPEPRGAPRPERLARTAGPDLDAALRLPVCPGERDPALPRLHRDRAAEELEALDVLERQEEAPDPFVGREDLHGEGLRAQGRDPDILRAAFRRGGEAGTEHDESREEETTHGRLRHGGSEQPPDRRLPGGIARNRRSERSRQRSDATLDDRWSSGGDAFCKRPRGVHPRRIA